MMNPLQKTIAALIAIDLGKKVELHGRVFFKNAAELIASDSEKATHLTLNEFIVLCQEYHSNKYTHQQIVSMTQLDRRVKLTMLERLARKFTSRLVYRRIRKLHKQNLELDHFLKMAQNLVSQLEEVNFNLHEQTTLDPVTNVKNRRFLYETIGRELAILERGEQRMPTVNRDITFYVAELDDFRHLCDEHGTEAGNALLRQFTEILKAASRGSDVIVRWTNEQFLIIARKTNREYADILAERVRSLTKKQPFLIANHQKLDLTCSIGFSNYPNGTQTWEDCVDEAVKNVMRAKAKSPGRWVGPTSEKPS